MTRTMDFEMEKISTSIEEKALEKSIERAKKALLEKQYEDGHWCYELEADCTIPAEYIMMMHFLGDIDEELEKKIAVYIRARPYE
ncbi:MAG: hypothetical protein R3350_11045 [Saprospiraceae bacterium]|nr:hypothetical protein [Saprospiraceae bacterium]